MILSHNPKTLTVYSAKELLQTYQSVHQNLTSYKQAFIVLLEWMRERFKKEGLYIQNHNLLDKKRKETKQSLHHKLKSTYHDFTFALDVVRDMKRRYETPETNPDYFHFQQLQEKLKKQMPSDVSIDTLFKQLHSSSSQLRRSLLDAKDRLQKRSHTLEKVSGSYPSYADFFKEAVALNAEKRRLVSLLIQYTTLFHEDGEEKVFSPVEFRALVSHVNHELSSGQIGTIHRLIPQGLHYMVYDFYLFAEIVWNHIAYQPTPNRLWTYIDCPLEKECSSVLEHQHILYALSLLHEPLTIATTFQKIQLSRSDTHSYERLVTQMISQLKQSNEIKTLLVSFIRFLNLLRLYLAIIKRLFSDRLRTDQNRFEQLWFSEIDDTTLKTYAQDLLSFRSFSAATITYGALYEKTLLAIASSLETIQPIFS